MDKVEDKLAHQLSKLGYYLTQLEYWYYSDRISYKFKKYWQGRIHTYMMNCSKQYADEVNRNRCTCGGFPDCICEIAGKKLL